jgi:hypothetical protein
VGPRTGLDVSKKSRPHQDFFCFFFYYDIDEVIHNIGKIRSPDRPVRSSVAIPTELPGPSNRVHNAFCFNLLNVCGIESGRDLTRVGA